MVANVQDIQDSELQAQLRDAVNPARLQANLEWFSEVFRDTGGPGEDRAAEYIASQMREQGIPVTVYEFDAFLSYPIRATLEVLEPEPMQIKCLTHSFGKSTGEQGLFTDLVYLEDADVNRAAGRAALIDGLATPVTILRASQAGCAAAIFANEDWVIHNMIGTTIWGTPGLDQLDRLPQLPVISVNKEGGETLKRLLAQDKGVKLRIVTEVKTSWTRSKLPEVRIPGKADSDEFVLVGAHYCAWEAGVTDNATGDTCLMEMARVLWPQRGELERSVRFCWWPGHSHGRYSGSTWYADNFFLDLAENCLVYHNIDSPGVKGATKYIARHTVAEAEHFCQSMIERVTGQPDAPIHRPSRAADQSFLANGIPSFSTYPFLPDDHPDKRPWTGGCANAWWWHSEHDTLDKADVDILTLDTQVSLTAVSELTNAVVSPFSHVDTGREMADFMTALAETVGDHLDLAPAIDEVNHFLEMAENFEDAKAEAATGEFGNPAAVALNKAQIDISRILNPVIYSQGGRFTHDPAEWSPIMRATGIYTMASLGKAANLPELDGEFEYGFLRAQVIRERNRVVISLRDASEVIERTLAAIG